METSSAQIHWSPEDQIPWSGVAKTPLLEFIAPRLATGGSEAAVIFEDGFVLTCEQLKDRAERLAGGLSKEIGPGDRVMISVGNRSEFLIAWLAILANRATAVCVSPRIASHDATHVVENSGVVLAIAEPASADVLEATGIETLRKVWRVGDPEPDGLVDHYSDHSRIDLASVEAEFEDLTDIGYTSGTTGLPKALASTHLDLMRYTDFLFRCFSFRQGDRFLSPLLFHYGDPLWMLMGSLEVGSPLIVMRKFSVSRFWQVAREYGVTKLLSIGAIPSLLLTAPESPSDREHSVDLAMAVAVPKEQHLELEERFGFPWIETYGTSESGPAIAMPIDAASRYAGSGALGIPVPEVEARLVDADGEVLEGAASGELELAGEVLFKSYLNNQEATAEVMHDGWYRSGDLMERDADGVYYFLGRRKELIRRGGENVAPAEVESVIRLHPAVIDTAVVPVEDPIRGEEVFAYVQVAPGSEVPPLEIFEFCSDRLAPYKLPRFISFRTEAFPRTPSQRIPKKQLMVDGQHSTEGAWDREHRE
ncbi:MAG: hypothetical protein QG596_150 [Actinomycetota bacterium]|nr:hypothetical protein [Actinomycetota bacterium]